jgi:thiol-disulfide isomerase/thioredoxin
VTTRRRSSTIIALLASLGLIALLQISAPVAGQPPGGPPPATPAFMVIGEYLLELDGGVDDEALIYHSRGRGSILVRSEELDKILELRPQDRTIVLWSEDQLEVAADGTVEVRGQGEPGGGFELVNDLPVLTAVGKKIRFLIKPAVLGTYDAAALKKKVPAYAERAKLHEPQETYLERLKELQEDLHIRVFFGTWCEVCTQMLPRILRTEEVLSEIGAPITFEYYGIPNDYDDAEVKRLEVNGLPTGILYFRGKELGRVVGHGWNFPTMAIYNQLIKPHDQTPRPREGR